MRAAALLFILAIQAQAGTASAPAGLNFFPPVSNALAEAFQPVLSSLDSSYSVRHLDLSDPRQRDIAAPILQVLAANDPSFADPATYRDPAVPAELKTSWLIMVMGEADELVWDVGLGLMREAREAKDAGALSTALSRLRRYDSNFLSYLANEGLGATNARIMERFIREQRIRLWRMRRGFSERVEDAADGLKNAS